MSLKWKNSYAYIENNLIILSKIEKIMISLALYLIKVTIFPL